LLSRAEPKSMLRKNKESASHKKECDWRFLQDYFSCLQDYFSCLQDFFLVYRTFFLSTGLFPLLASSVDVVGNVLGLPLVFGRGLLVRIADDDGAEWDDVLGHAERLCHLSGAFRDGVEARLNGTEAEGVGGQ